MPTSALASRRGARVRVPAAGRGEAGDPSRSTRHTGTAAASAAILGIIAAVLMLTPVPFVVRAPATVIAVVGGDRAPSLVQIAGVPTYPPSGRLSLVGVQMSPQESFVTLPEALLAHWSSHRDAMPWELVYAPGKTSAHLRRERFDELTGAKDAATVAGLRAAGVEVSARPVVTSVNTAGPSYGLLRPGDFVLQVAGRPVSRPEDIYSVVAAARIGDEISFRLLRDGVARAATVTIVASNDDVPAPSIGARIDLGYAHSAQVSYQLPDDVAGAAHGLPLALAVYEQAASGDLLRGRTVAATGTIDAKGVVGPVRGLRERLASAEAARVDVLLIPEAGCASLRHSRTSVRVVPVPTLAAAIEALNDLSQPATAPEVPTCP